MTPYDEQLASHDPGEACPVFFGDGDYAFWGVHGSVEIALHRCDVLSALERSAELEPSEAPRWLVVVELPVPPDDGISAGRGTNGLARGRADAWSSISGQAFQHEAICATSPRGGPR